MKTYLEPVEVEKLEQAAGYLRDKLLIRLLSRLGCRISEVLGISVSNIDFSQGTVTIEHLKVLIQEKKIDWITFTSSSTVDNFVEIVGHDFMTTQRDRLPVASIGPVTTATLEKYGMQPQIRAAKHTFEGLVNSIIQGEQHG